MEQAFVEALHKSLRKSHREVIKIMETIDKVRRFWESQPLWTGESNYKPGTKEFFEEHLRVVTEDCYAGTLDERFFPNASSKSKILELGCGPGPWIIEHARRDCKDISAVDLTQNGLSLARKRCEIYGIEAKFSQQNAEMLGFLEATFSHVNCQGVIQATPDTKACIREIALVLDENGTASISVYYRNIFLRAWFLLKWPAKLLAKMGAGLLGRGRQNIYTVNDVNKIVRLYDGKDNPVGKSYTRRQFIEILKPYFDVQETYLHYFPARTLPFKLPKIIHKFLDRHAGFMIYATVKKR
jgi:2-polyprenyl-3-methyl-5-hydroxy-6-metoxy-1,4-benzoquinol methylase